MYLALIVKSFEGIYWNTKSNHICQRLLFYFCLKILKVDLLLDIIRKFQQILIETVKIRFEQPILNDSILLKL